MKADIKALWVDALRSGLYKQGKYQLREQGDFYDPVGVLCELAVSAGVIAPATFTPREKHAIPDRSWSGYKYVSNDPLLRETGATGIPKDVAEWADLSYYLGMRVSRMGDKGKKFSEIADYIEKEF